MKEKKDRSILFISSGPSFKKDMGILENLE